MIQVSQQLRDPARFGVIGQHGQDLDLGPDGEVGFIGRVLPLQGSHTSAKVAELVTICLTCFSRYLVLQHCRNRSHLTRPLAWVWPVNRRNQPKFSANSLRSLPVNSGRLPTILEVAIALGS